MEVASTQEVHVLLQQSKESSEIETAKKSPEMLFSHEIRDVSVRECMTGIHGKQTKVIYTLVKYISDITGDILAYTLMHSFYTTQRVVKWYR